MKKSLRVILIVCSIIVLVFLGFLLMRDITQGRSPEEGIPEKIFAEVSFSSNENCEITEDDVWGFYSDKCTFNQEFEDPVDKDDYKLVFSTMSTSAKFPEFYVTQTYEFTGVDPDAVINGENVDFSDATVIDRCVDSGDFTSNKIIILNGTWQGDFKEREFLWLLKDKVDSVGELDDSEIFSPLADSDVGYLLEDYSVVGNNITFQYKVVPKYNSIYPVLEIKFLFGNQEETKLIYLDTIDAKDYEIEIPLNKITEIKFKSLNNIEIPISGEQGNYGFARRDMYLYDVFFARRER